MGDAAADVVDVPADRCADHPLDREQRHLGVVGDPSSDRLAVDHLRRVGADTTWPALGADLVETPELHGAAQSVTDRTAEEAAADAGAILLELLPVRCIVEGHEGTLPK